MLAILGGALIAALVASPGSDDPVALYVHARSVWRSQSYPAVLRYTIVVHYRLNGRDVSETHQALWRKADDLIAVKAISAEENADPHVPRGINVGLPGVKFTQEFFEPMGVPRLSPVYSFGLARGHDLATVEGPNDSGLHEIGRVNIVPRDYTIAFAGVEPCADGAQADHLTLTPLRKPDQFPLRDMWVREHDGTTCRLNVAHNFSHSPLGTGPWQIEFAQFGIWGTLIAREHPLAPVTLEHKQLDDFSIEFTNLAVAKDDVHTDLWLLDLSGTDRETTEEPAEDDRTRR